MTFTPDNYLLLSSLLLLVSIFASKASYKIGAPLLLLFLGIGLFAGQKITFDNSELTSLVGELALVFILFSGGLDTKYKDIRPVAISGMVLSTLGVFLTAIFLGGFIYFVMQWDFVPIQFSLAESLLLGSIVSSTDAASVFSIFRSKNMGLKENLRPLLELESGSNDPMAYVLTISLVTFLVDAGTGTASRSLWLVIPDIATSLTIGAALGFVFGKIFVRVVNRINLFVEGLYPVMIIALMALAFSATKTLHGNGFLAVYIAGLILGNSKFIHKKLTLKFYEGTAWMMQILLFLTLGLFADFQGIKAVAVVGVLISLFLIFVARPLAVGACLIPFRPSWRVFTFTSWVGLRGAVPIVFALIPLSTENFDDATARLIFNIVFFISVSSLILQGTTLFPVAKWLGLTLDDAEQTVSAFDKDTEEINTSSVEITLSPGHTAVGKTIAELELPSGVLVVMIRRGNEFLTPKGNTLLRTGDILQIQADAAPDLSLAQEQLFS